jgi:hypothetical protein
MVVTLIPVSFYIFYLAYLFPVCFLIYFIAGYVVVASLNNSFVITDSKLVVINPNFPFRKVKSYSFEQINKVKIDSSNLLYITAIFAHFGSNYVELTTQDKVERFYCTSLDVDAFDENFTEKTIDDFHASLKQHKVYIEFNLD